jgi:hypothetical protein
VLLFTFCTHTHTHVCTHSDTRTHKNTCTQHKSCTQHKTHLHVYTHTQTHTCKHSQTQPHVYTHTHFIFNSNLFSNHYVKMSQIYKKIQIIIQSVIELRHLFYTFKFCLCCHPSFASVLREEVDIERHCTC